MTIDLFLTMARTSFKSIVFACFIYLVAASSSCLQEDGDEEDASYHLSPHLQHVSEFSLNLFRLLVPPVGEGNLFMSPYSVWNALALAYLGAGGDTEEQLQQVLGIKSKEEALKKWRAVDYVYQMRQLQSVEYQFGLVNKAYFSKDIQLRDCIHDILDFELERIDFTQQVDSAQKINGFVSNMTEGFISSVISPSDIEPNTQMALVNAAFFRDMWKTPFKKSQTRRQRFYSFDDSEQYVQMMSRKGEFKHGVSEELRAHVLELPYSMKEVSMFIFLPPSVEGKAGLEHLLQNLTEMSLERAIDEVWFDNIEVAVPKMSLATAIGPELIKSLKELGIKDLFDPSLADLTTFVPQGGISVSKAFHQTFLDVDEEGTEASATTVILGTGRSARPSRLRSFICDHPFVFTIYDKFTKNVLFIGVYRNALE